MISLLTQLDSTRFICSATKTNLFRLECVNVDIFTKKITIEQNTRIEILMNNLLIVLLNLRGGPKMTKSQKSG